MRKQPRIVGIVSLIFMSCTLSVISGCASQVPILVENLNTESSCCSNYAEFHFEGMPLDKEIKFSIGPGDKAYLFPTGKSYFKSFRLPDFDDSRSLEIRTYLIGGWIPTSHVFVPALTFLNDTYSPIDDVVTPELFYDEGFIDGSRWTSLVDMPPDSKYVIFHTVSEHIHKRISLGSTPGYAYSTPATGPVFVPASGERSAAYGPSGTLKVRFLPKIH